MYSAAKKSDPAERPWAVFARRDLVVRRQIYRDEVTWVIKDPVNLQYYYFRDEEYAVLQWLDGKSSPQEIQNRFAQRFTPSKLTRAELHQFIHQLHGNGLVLSDKAGQGEVLLNRRRKKRRWAWLTGMGNILSLRFRGVDPDRFFNWLHPKIRWVFTPAAVCCVVLLILAAVTLVGLHFDTFRRELPSSKQVLTPTNLAAMAVVLCVVKILHEFGHGLSCKHFGGECHELGLMLLVLTPCLYCGVSDSALLASKWKRAAVAFAGIYVELFLASLAVFLWWFTRPGPLHYLAISTVVYCSVSTLIFNGNPLMRYDGYYVLADLLEIPNLRGRASQAVRRLIQQCCLGIEFPIDPRMPSGWAGAGLWIFAVASEVYRWVVTASVLWFLHRFLAPYRLEVFGHILAAASIGALIVTPLWRLGKFLKLPGRIDQMKRKNIIATAIVLAGLAAVVFLLPIPHRVLCVAEVQPDRAESVYAELPGTLAEVYVKQGDAVVLGQELARLVDLDLELVLDELVGQRDKSQSRLSSLQLQRTQDPAIASQIPEVTKSLASIEEQITEKQAELKKLILVAPCAGVVWAPPATPKSKDPEHQLAGWSGTPLDRENLRAFLSTGTLFCLIGPADGLQAELIVDQSDIELVERGQRVDLQIKAIPQDILHGQVDEIAKRELTRTPQQLSNKGGGELATRTDAAGHERPVSASYQVRVPIEHPPFGLRPGNAGEARIHVAYRPIAMRCWRWLQHTFYFRT